MSYISIKDEKIKILWESVDNIIMSKEGICEFFDSYIIRIDDSIVPLSRVIRIDIIKEEKKIVEENTLSKVDTTAQ